MRTKTLWIVLIFLSSHLLLADEPAIVLRDPWQTEYADEDATGPHVMALWQFNEPKPLEDASSHDHPISLEGGKIISEGRFGGCLETFCGWPVGDERHRALTPNRSDLSPRGAFSLEMSIRPKPELDADYPESFLLDKKYVAHDDYQLILGSPNPNGSRSLKAILGFGAESSTYHSWPATFEPGHWYHVAFCYDGEGTGSFFLDGKPWGSTYVTGRKSISPGTHLLSIGDRIGSYYHGFPGYIDQVRITRGVREFRSIRLQRLSDRACFVRREPNARLQFRITNLLRVPLSGATATISLDSIGSQSFPLSDLASGETTAIDYPLDTSLRSDDYTLSARIDVASPNPFSTEERLSLQIVPRKPPNQFPVLMWGVYGGVSREIERIKRIGFTHVLGLGADNAKILAAGKSTEAAEPEQVSKSKQMLDDALASDLTVVASLSPGSFMRSREAFRRVDREGNVFQGREDVCGLFDTLQKHCYHVGASMSQTYGHFPAFGAAMVHTEVRGHARPCFHDHDRESFRQSTGLDIPKEIVSPRGVDHTKLPDFPTSRVIADDHPIYVYSRWYWKEGDGWNGLNSQLDAGLKSTACPDFWTFHDPAVRVASVYGSGGSVDYLSQWTYSYPDPIRIGLATDELIAMAAGSEHEQQVMKMTQIIWYRGQTAPESKSKTSDEVVQRGSPKAAWEIEQPDAPFITIPPMHLREAFWTKIARPIRGIMYHGWQSLVPCEGTSGYRYTHPQTQHELARLIRQVVRPLGPTLLQVPGVKSDVAMLESFASQMFARRGTYGWNGSWAGDCYLVLQYAHLQPEIIYDETITERGLDGFRVLVMPDCDVLTEKMVERIQLFQASGGLIVGDEKLCPAIKPDLTIPVFKRTGRADADKRSLLELAKEFRSNLDPHYTRTVDSTHPEVIPYLRRRGTTDYLFVVNDRREYGRYVGRHGLVMENGLPSETTLSIKRSAGFVYDLTAQRQIPTRLDADRLVFDARLGPCDGTVFMISDRAIDGVHLELPESASHGESSRCVITIVDSKGQSLDAVIPIEVALSDSEGREVEFSGYYGAFGGRVEIPLDIAPNSPFGIWQLKVRELATGRTSLGHFRVPGPNPWPPSTDPPSKLKQ